MHSYYLLKCTLSNCTCGHLSPDAKLTIYARTKHPLMAVTLPNQELQFFQ